MKALKDVLQPLSSATNVLSSSKHATVSLVLPLKVKIVKKCRPSTDNDTFIAQVKKKILDNLSPR